MSTAKQLLLLTFLQISLLTVQGQSKAATEAVTPVKKMIAQIRASQDAQALNQMEMVSISRYLLGAYYDKATEQQRNEFSNLFQSLFARIAFSRVRENFKNLASIYYDPPAISGNEATVASLVIIDNPLKKQEIKMRYTVVKGRAGWQVKDVAVLGSSLLESIRDDQVQPVLKEGGMEHLLQVMRDKKREK
jgi:phospholipid transport system substrate-binding protein